MELEQLLTKLEPSEIFPLLVVTIFAVVGVVVALPAIVLGNWRKVRERQITASLIQDMMDRGMAYDQIVGVIAALSNDDAAGKATACRVLSSRKSDKPPRQAAKAIG
jgi:hypothetical protein